MKRSTEILEELEQISPAVAKISGETPYHTPVGYFDSLNTVIMARIAAGGNEENSLLHVAGKHMPQDVPQGYFATLPGNILSKIKAQGTASVSKELNELSPLLAGLNKANLYEVPAGYFEHLPSALTAHTTTEAKVVSMFSKKIWIRFAAAAVLFGLIAFGISFFTKQSAINAPGIPTAKTEEQINTELASISDEEIINYLKMTSDSKDVAAISSVLDQSQLPSEADYMDNAFMETFMKELEQTENKTN